MRHFMIVGRHLGPVADLAPWMAEHRAFLADSLHDGHLLFTAHQIDQAVPFLIARHASADSLRAMFAAQEPFVREGKLELQIIEFEPGDYRPDLGGWFGNAVHDVAAG